MGMTGPSAAIGQTGAVGFAGSSSITMSGFSAWAGAGGSM